MNTVGKTTQGETVVLPTAFRSGGISAHDFTYDYVRGLILQLIIPPDTILTEQAVCDAIQVSRTPVREVFLRLSAEGLIEIIPRRGAYVVPITYRQIREIAETRKMFESYVARIACDQGLRLADTLLPLIDLQRSLTLEGPDNVIRIVEADRNFHLALIQSIGNTELFNAYAQLHERQLRTGISLFRKFPERKVSAPNEHERIALALAEFDVEQVLPLIHEHLVGSIEGLEAHFLG